MKTTVTSPLSQFLSAATVFLLMLNMATSTGQRAHAAYWQENEPADETQQIKTAERFLSVLEKNPRYGTALDRVYGHHVEFGSLDSFLASLNERAQGQSDNGAVWMLLGMFESQRGGDAAAVAAFTKADQLRSQDALASFYLGQAQLRVGQSVEAIESFERAISRKPQRADLLEIFQTLGRVHQRAQRTDEAMKVWQRLESLFPNDPRVLEQIAVTLAEEGQPALALPRYQKLAELERDDYRKVIYQVAAAGLTIKAGQKEDGIKQLEKVLADLNPTSWLYRDVRRRIEDVFLRSGDQDSLVKYYERWLDGHPEDVEGMSRLARFLASSARVPEATLWMEKALKLAPTRTDLRKSFIDQLVEDQRIPEAILQYEQLVKATPGNLDFLRDWGKLVLRNREISEEDRQKQAVSIWNQILATRPDDALTVSQVADLYRQNKMNNEAEKLYKKAVELAQGDPQYREYLGEFLHVQKRSDEALAVWQGIAEGNRRNAVNITRLAEIYNSFGFPEKAIVEIAEAVKLDPKDFSLQIRAAEYHAKASKYDEAMAFVDAANALAAGDDERDAVIQQRIEVLQVSQQLDIAADELVSQLRKKTDANSADWYLAARYLEAGRRWPEANEAVDNAIQLDPKSIPAMTVAARIAETSGDYGRAAKMCRTLADSDRRSRSDHLMNVSRLEAQMGRTAEALQAAQELIIAAPGKTENYEFYAQTCFRLGRADEGLDTLRKAVRINPNEPQLIMSLGNALADQLRTEEAIEVYWRAFEKSEEVEDKVGLTMKLAPLYQQINQFDKLVDRFERDRKEEDKRREATICLAQAWQTAGDIASAKQELESLLSEDTRDTNLLNQLAKLCQTGADLEAAIGYQRQLVAIAPGHETEFPLAGMLMSNGQLDEAREIFVKLTQREEDPVRQIKSLDSLITQGNFESAIGVIDPLLTQNRDDWELLYREGVAWASLEKKDEAMNRFQRILALNLPFDSLGRSAAERLKQAQAKAKSDNLRGITSVVPQKQSPLAMRQMSSQIQRATGLMSNQNYYSAGQTPPVWTPESFGLARMAAYGWLLRFEDEAMDLSKGEAAKNAGNAAKSTENATQSIVDQVREKAELDSSSREAIYDWLYVAGLKNDYPAIFNIAKRLVRTGGKEELQFFLSSLALRNTDAKQMARSNSGSATADKKPLGEEDLQLVRESYQKITDADTNVDPSAIYGSNIVYASNGQAYVLVGGNYVPLAGGVGGEYLTILVDELRLAGKIDEAQELLNSRLAKAASANELANALSLLAKEDRHAEMLDYLDRWQQAALKQIAETPVVASTRGAAANRGRAGGAAPLQSVQNTIQQWMGKLGAEEENAQVLAILARCLTVAEAEAKHRRQVQAAQTRKASAVGSQSSFGQFAVYYGKNTSYSNITFPPSSDWIDYSACMLLYQAHDILKRNDVVSDLSELLRKRLQDIPNNSEENDRLLCNNLYLASALWWAEEQEEAVDWMAKAAQLAGNELSMQFSLASMYQTRGDFEDALNVIESIVPRDQRLLQRREMMALTLAERLGDTDRARSAAERLFGLRLDSQTQISLVDRMKRLGLNSLADAILARAERTATNQASSLASLMMLYQGQGKAEQAIQLAHMLLRKTPSPISITQRGGRNPSRYRDSESSFRTQALQLLQQSGELKNLIATLESQLLRSPDSIFPLQQLIEFYGITGQKEEAQKKIQQALKVRPDSPILRMQLAKQLEQSGKTSEACDQYLELLKIQPNWITDELYQINNIFTRAKRKTDLVKALSQINMKQVSQPYYLVDTASNLLQDESTAATGLAFLERIFEAFPNYRSYLLQNIRNDSVWKVDGFYQFTKRIVLPSEQDIRNNPWMGLDQINSYNSDGEASLFLHQVLQGIKTTDKLKDLESSLKEQIDKQPGWHSGKAMLALIEVNSNRKTDAQKRFKELAEDESLAKTMPAEACWIIGQELNRFDDTRELAMGLFERAVNSKSRNSTNQLQYSPLVKLIEGYAQAGKKDKARELLLKQLSSVTFDEYDREYASYQKIQNSTWAATKLQSMGMPIDALKLYRQLLDDPEKLAGAARWNGNGNDYYEKTVRKGLADSLALVTSKNADEAIAQLLTVPEKLTTGSPSVDLMLSFPDAKSLENGEIKSSYLELLKTLSSEASVADKVATRLAEMADQYPNDLAIQTALTAWKLNMKRQDAAEAVRKLVVLASDQPLEKIPEGRRPNSRQRREAARLIPLWLVARECIGTENLSEDGMKLADICHAAVARQLGIKEKSAILFDWGNQLIKAGRKDEAEARWSELLDLAIERPVRKAATPPKTGLKTKKLWNTQFQTALKAVGSSILNDVHPALSMLSILQAGPKAPPATGANRNAANRNAAATVIQESIGQQSTASPDAAKEPASRIPPLTMSQFRTAIAVAQAAAKNQMPELSRKAVKESLKGGLPIPDPEANAVSNDPFGGGTVIRSGMANQSPGESADPEVIKSLKEIFSLWKAEAYSSQDRYSLLKAIVLPETKAQDIRLYVTSADLSSAKIESLAETVIAEALEAGQLDDLRKSVAMRLSSANKTLAGKVFEILIDLKQGNTQSVAEKLNEVAQQLRKGIPSSDQQIAFLAGVRAYDVPDLREAAVSILQHSLQQASSAQNNETAMSSRLASMVNRHLAEKGDSKSIQEYFDNLLLRRQSVYSRYSGDSGLQMQWMDLAALAQQASELKLPTVAMDYLGRAADFEVARYQRPNMNMTLANVIHHSRNLPPEERYESWYKWTMPQESRQTLRALHEVCSPTFVPQSIVKADSTSNQLQPGLCSNFTELVAAANQAGKIGDLRSKVQSLADEKMASADILLALILISQNDPAAVPLVESFQNTLEDRLKPETGVNRARKSANGDYLVYQACLSSEKLVGLFEDQLPQFRARLQASSQPQLLQRVNFDWARRVTSRAKPDVIAPSSRFKHWIAANSNESTGRSQLWWTSFEDQLVLLGNNADSALYLQCPLTGNFQVSIDCFEDSGAAGNVGFGGVLAGNIIQSVSGHESITRARPSKRNAPTYNRMTIDVRDNVTRYLLNNQLYFQEENASTSPWLFLSAAGHQLGAFRNVRINGDVVIPQTVSLIDNDRMDGWNCSTFAETQPRQRLMKEKPASENDSVAYYQKQEPTVFSWSARGGQLTGTAIESAAGDEQSWLYYQRPLMEGDSISYQFFYVPGSKVAHPTIGQIALMLEADGCKTHWITTAWDTTVHGIQPGNVIVEPGIQSNSGKLPLKEGDWNDVQLSLTDNKAVVKLNGSVVCKRPMEQQLGTRFGLFRFKNQSSQIRNLVLTGAWPQTFPAEQDLISLEQPEPPEFAQTVSQVVNDWMIAPLAGEVVQKARSMSPDAAFEFLSNWVLPSATHSNVRLHCSNSTAVGGKEPSNILCPATELISIAAQQNKLPQLAKAAEQLKPTSASQQHSINAFNTLIALESSADELVEKALQEKISAVSKPYDKGTPAIVRNADFLIAWRAGLHPRHWIAGSKIAHKLRAHERDAKTSSGSALYKQRVNSLVGDIERYARSQGEGSTRFVSSPQWTTVPYFKPEHRLAGHRPSTWAIDYGVAENLPAETWGQLFFQSPLRGKFEILVNKTTHGHKEVSVAWGMHSADPRHDLKAVRVSKLMHNSKDLDKEVKLPFWDQQAEYRIVVDGQKVTTFTNGVQVHEEIFDRDPDPWLLIQSQDAHNFARVSNLRIVGTPEIPTEIDLLNLAGLASWRADIYGEWFRTEADSDNSPNVPWRRYDDELRGQHIKNAADEYRESLIMYQRPMLEDGVIEFETWYEPGVTEVHPALGRSAFLLTPSGVLLHRLTDAQYETSGLKADNQAAIPGAAASLTMKANDWNQIRLTLKGDQLTINVNGADVATQTIAEPANQRQFGLFRYSNKTAARVRKVTYKGEWPRTLPPLKDQLLAESSAASLPADSRVVVDVDFTQPIENSDKKVSFKFSPDRRESSSNGLKLHMHDSKNWEDRPRMSFKEPIEGDCEITLTYKDLQLTPPKSGWGVIFSLEALVGEKYRSRTELGLNLDKDNNLQNISQLCMFYGVMDYTPVESLRTRPASSSGRLRLVRTGGRMDCYMAADGADDFIHLNSLTVGHEPITEVNWGGNSSDEFAKMDVTLTRLTIRR